MANKEIGQNWTDGAHTWVANPVPPPDDLAAPAVDGRWLRPVAGPGAEPRWGHPDGIQVGIHPIPGPRGLLRIFAPHLDHPRSRLINFIAVEPIVTSRVGRGLSELEHSGLDDVPGKRFWATDDPDDPTPQAPDRPARGLVRQRGEVEELTVIIGVEPFENGAHVAVRITFRSDRPHEVSLAALRRADSADLDHCILSATMGNFARLRRLHLADRVVHPTELWPDFSGDHFTDHASFGLDDLVRTGDEVRVSATPDEQHPQRAHYDGETPEHWKYVGLRATQTWRAVDPHLRLRAQVNGRHAYWAGTVPIPGGTAYENFELVEPFRHDRELTFAVDRLDETA